MIRFLSIAAIMVAFAASTAESRAISSPFDPVGFQEFVTVNAPYPSAQEAPTGMDPAPEGITFPIDVEDGPGMVLSRKLTPRVVVDGEPVRYMVGKIAKFRVENCVENVGKIRWSSGHDYADPPKVLDTNGSCTMRYRFLSPGDQEIRAILQLWTEGGRRMTAEQEVRPFPLEVADLPTPEKRSWLKRNWKWAVPLAVAAGGGAAYASGYRLKF